MFQSLDRWSRWTVVVSVLLLPFLIYGVLHLPVGSASVHQWLPEGKPEKQRYERFLHDFGSDQFLIASWENCRIEDPRLQLFCNALTDDRLASDSLIASVQSSHDVLRLLTEPPLRLSTGEAESRLRGFLIGADGTASVIVRFTNFGIAHQNESMKHIFESSEMVPGLGRGALRMAGTVYEAYAVDYAAEQSLKNLVLPSCLIGVGLAWICLRSIRAAIAVLIIAGFGQLLAISVVYYTGGQFSAVLIVLPTLVFMLTLSGAVHLMNYYRDVVQWHGDHLGSRAMVLGFKPSLLSSITTSLGMASLAVSQLAPVREFGLYSAASLSLATVFLLLGFPFISDWFCRTIYTKAKTCTEVDSEIPVDDVASHPVSISPFAASYVLWMSRNAIWVASIGLLLMAFSFYGLTYLKSSTKFEDMFPANSPTVRDMSFIERHIGPIASIEVLMRFPPDSDLEVLDRTQWVDRISQSIQRLPDVGAVMSAVSYLPKLPETGSIRDVTKRSVMRAKLKEAVPTLVDQGWVAEGVGGQVWRITAKVSALSDDDYGALTSHVAQAVKSVVAASDIPVPFESEFTGLSPVMHETQMMLLKDFGASFTVAFILITPVMMLIARGFWAGLLIMIPNVLPETLVFGGMAWLGFHLDIAGLLTASVAMGIAVNDTLHFMNWYARRLSLGDSRIDAIGDTMTSCAVAMFHTMLISCCSMLPFLFAEFIPTRQFACLMIAMLGSSILGDLVLLPALLLSPLGRCLIPKIFAVKK
ncbi:MAG: MMPL family transporter [Planctomycetota bacterium]|nr:MMPL family transporter [Planctomycetota bacterium]